MRPQLKVNGRNRHYVDLDKPIPGAPGNFHRIPGVTTIVKDGMAKPSLINWAGEATVDYTLDHWEELGAMPLSERRKKMMSGRYATRDEAADKGRLIHRIAQELVTGKTVPVPDELAGYVNGCVKFLNEFDARPFAIEMLVYSETHYYCGQLDLGCNVVLPDLPEFDYIARDEDGRSRALIDYKSGRSGIWGDLTYQLSPYAFAEFAYDEFGDVIEVPEFDFGAGVHLRPDGNYTVSPVEISEAGFQGFLTFKAAAEELQRTREYMNEPLVPPLTTQYRMVPIEDL